MIIGDNGASAEGSLQGTFNEMITLGGFGALETPEFMSSQIDKFGGPEAYNHYAVGWAHAMDTPYQWTKQVASHFGGTRNGTIVHWPRGIEAKGEMRTQFHHVIDVAPTVLEVAGLPQPTFVNGVQQKPIEGVCMAYSFDDARRGRAARDAVLRDVRQPRHLPQGLDRGDQAPHAVGDRRRREHAGVRRRRLGALRHDHRLDAGARSRRASIPTSSHELQRLWLIEAVKYNVLPLDDRFVERGLPETRRPADADPGHSSSCSSAAWAG